MTGSIRLASVDIGTNSTRLLIADCNGKGTSTVAREMKITRLGEGVDRTGVLSPRAAERTLLVLERYRNLMLRSSVQDCRAAATSAVRDCENGNDFLDRAGSIIGVRPEVLTGSQEASLSFMGAVSGLDARWCIERYLLVFDIGGGSTEIMVGTAGEHHRPGSCTNVPAGSTACISGGRKGSLGGGVCDGSASPAADYLDATLLDSGSVDVGCVRMSERFLVSNPPAPVELARMEAYARQVLQPLLKGIMPVDGNVFAVGLAGTVTTLSGIRQGITEYRTELIHHSRLNRLDAKRIYRRLARVPVEVRKEIMGLEPGRADVIVGGAAVLLALMELAGIEEVLVSEKDILDGLVLECFRSNTAGEA